MRKSYKDLGLKVLEIKELILSCLFKKGRICNLKVIN